MSRTDGASWLACVNAYTLSGVAAVVGGAVVGAAVVAVVDGCALRALLLSLLEQADATKPRTPRSAKRTRPRDLPRTKGELRTAPDTKHIRRNGRLRCRESPAAGRGRRAGPITITCSAPASTYASSAP